MTPEKRYANLVSTAIRLDSGCLIATLGSRVSGYRRVWVGDAHIMAHRLASEIEAGRTLLPWPQETVDHTCHNDSGCPGGVTCPHRECIEPSHLEAVDSQTNWERGNQGAPALWRSKTHCPRGHPYEEGNLRATKNGSRGCLTCHREREAVRRANK